MKRTREMSITWSGDCDEESDYLPPRPAKRLSMIDNTPQQWKEERRYILRLSKQKLKKMDNPLRDLQKSVLITNTTRRMKIELEEFGVNKYRGYKRNHAPAVVNKRKLRQRVNSWETMLKTNQVETMPELCSQTTFTDSISSSECAPDVAASIEQQQSAACESDLSAAVLCHLMDIDSAPFHSSSPSSQSSDVMTNECDKSCCTRDMIADEQTTVISCETDSDSSKQNCSYQQPDNNNNTSERPLAASNCADCVKGSSNTNDVHYTSLQKAAPTDKQSHINEYNYSAVHSHQTMVHSQQHTDISQAAVASTPTSVPATTTGDLYAMYGMHYKQYCSYAAYLPVLQQQQQHYSLQNPFLFTLAELVRNNHYTTSPSPFLQHSNSANYFATSSLPCFDSDSVVMKQSDCLASDFSDSEEAYIDVMT